ncbi:MAG: dihydropteroate synthase [Negativicutes bacterium]|nr:dihydropteroate synthase [Negativicutes bacterium]
MIVIGEKINSSIPSVAKAIGNMDKEFIQKLAQDQVKAGAGVIDVNAGAFLDRETELLIWLVNVVQEVTDVPLCVDSPSAEALEAALAVVNKKAVINSISAEKERYDSVIPLVKRHKSSVIALCMDDKGIPATAAQRIEIAKSLTARLVADGVSPDDIYLDVMVQPIGTDNCSGREALETVRAIKEAIPGVHITSGLSNVSYGLPKRKLLNQAFAVALAAYGMDVLFIDPLDERMMALLSAIQALTGCDEYCCDYLTAFRAGKLG